MGWGLVSCQYNLDRYGREMVTKLVTKEIQYRIKMKEITTRYNFLIILFIKMIKFILHTVILILSLNYKTFLFRYKLIIPALRK